MRRHILVVLWPAFLTAAVLEGVVFSLVDPGELHAFGGGGSAGWPAPVVYSVAFLAFWGLVAVSGALTLLLAREPREVNRRPIG